MRLLRLTIILLSALPLGATTWHACSNGGNINDAAKWKDTYGGSSCTCSGATLTWGSQVKGDIFEADGCTTPINVNVDPLTPATLTGTVSFTNGSTTVTGVSTLFSTEVSAGDWIWIAGAPVTQVASVTNNTTLVLSTTCAQCAGGYYGPTASGTGFDGLVTLTDNKFSSTSLSSFVYNTTSFTTLHANVLGDEYSGSSGLSTLDLQVQASHTLNFIGSAIGSTQVGIPAISDSGRGNGTTINFYGPSTGGSITNSWGYYMNSSDTSPGPSLNFYGPLAGGTGQHAYGLYDGINTAGYSLTTVNNNVYAGSCVDGGGCSGILSGQSAWVTVNGFCVGANSTQQNPGCNADSGVWTITGGLINGYKSQAIVFNRVGGVIFAPASTACYEMYAADASYTLGVNNAHATVIPCNPGISNVRTGTTYGTFFTGTYGGGGSGVTPYSF